MNKSVGRRTTFYTPSPVMALDTPILVKYSRMGQKQYAINQSIIKTRQNVYPCYIDIIYGFLITTSKRSFYTLESLYMHKMQGKDPESSEKILINASNIGSLRYWIRSKTIKTMYKTIMDPYKTLRHRQGYKD